MAVFVDDMRANFGRMVMCHMIAHTHEELLGMVDKIGMQRKWIQYEGQPDEHFDISLSMRAKAVKNGAIETTWRRLGCMIAVRKRIGVLPKPKDAEAELLKLREAVSA
jgi:hypothetical protein